jgi:hypothetical protein
MHVRAVLVCVSAKIVTKLRQPCALLCFRDYGSLFTRLAGRDSAIAVQEGALPLHPQAYKSFRRRLPRDAAE